MHPVPDAGCLLSVAVRIAAAYVVKHEKRHLERNIRWHRHLGVDEFHVYCDGVDLETYADLRRIPGVTLSPARSTEEMWESLGDRLPPFLRMLATGPVDDAMKKEFVIRKTLHLIEAATDARDRGVDWFLQHDPDELICLDPEVARADHLKEVLAAVDPAVAQVAFSTYEVVGGREHYDDVFTEETLFKSMFVDDGGVIRETDLSYSAHDPVSRVSWRQNGYFGVVNGKSAGRLAAGVVPNHLHYWSADGSPPPATNGLRSGRMLALLHYYCYDFDDFFNKFCRNYGSRYVWGREHTIRKMWWRVGCAFPSEEVLRAYYREHVLWDRARALERSRDPASGIVEIRAPARFFSGDAAAPDAGLAVADGPRHLGCDDFLLAEIDARMSDLCEKRDNPILPRLLPKIR